jgi:hypothetical protein
MKKIGLDSRYIFVPGDASLVGLVEICTFGSGNKIEI